MILLNGVEIKPTIFPDKTSQIWKLDESLFRKVNIVDWLFENESELIHVMQLGDLLYTYSDVRILAIPYLPYGRQDKTISNESTFALRTFCKILQTSEYTHIRTVDAHSSLCESFGIENISPNPTISNYIELLKPDVICFPDKGASQRGYTTEGLTTIHLDKKRNQLTGEIEGLEYLGDIDLTDRSILIVDDLCDGGRTFIEAAKILKTLNVKNVDLYTTHGIYSKGIQYLKDNGIGRIFNLNGEV